MVHFVVFFTILLFSNIVLHVQFLYLQTLYKHILLLSFKGINDAKGFSSGKNKHKHSAKNGTKRKCVFLVERGC